MSYFPATSEGLDEPRGKPNCKCTSSLNSRRIPQLMYGPGFPNPNPQDWHELPSRAWIYGNWYSDPSLSEPWSTDWEWWDGLSYYEDKTVDGKLKIEQMFKDDFDVPGTVEPVAYMTSYGDEFFFFTAAGRYYFWADGCLTVHRMQFGSPKEFLDHALQKDDMPDIDIPMRRGSAGARRIQAERELNATIQVEVASRWYSKDRSSEDL
ncbi:hypothetical protein K438DRAFT_1939284 [Mycena galopus ATCC 62051]|nr:hypothetical protein K438DRAFT_1939284 [Mycena galopus ATCC 62051]